MSSRHSTQGIAPSPWPNVPLDELCDSSRGITYGIVKVGDFIPDGVPVVRGGDIRDGAIVCDDSKRVSSAVSDQFRRTVLRGGEIVLNLISEPGHSAVVPVKFAGHNVSRDVAVVPIKETVDVRFVDYFLKSPLAVGWLNARLQGSVTQKINLGTLRELPVPMPALREQVTISSLLGSLDDRTILLRETNATLEAIAQALFKSWFVDFDPVRAKSQGLAPAGMDEATAALFPDHLEGRTPAGWSTEPLGDWLTVLETGRRPKGGVSGITAGVPSIGAESVVRVGHFDFSKTKFVSKEFFDSMRSGSLQSRDVLLYKDGGKPGVFLPRVSMFGDGFPFNECGINEHVFRLRTKEPMGQTFLYFMVWSDAVMHELKHRGGKAAIPGINQSDVREVKVLVPNGQVLRRFEELTEPLVAAILNNAKRIQTLVTLRDTLLPRLISGQLRLPEAQAELEAAA